MQPVVIRIDPHAGARTELRRLFELADGSAAELDSYIDAGLALDRVRAGARDDGIELRDRVWLDLGIGEHGP
jgi:hypothetical protein